MNATTWKSLDQHFAHVETIAGRVLTRSLNLPDKAEIDRAATLLGCTFADNYAEFLLRYGGATVGSLPVYGLRPVEASAEPQSVVKATEFFRQEQVPGTDGWYIISDNGFGSPIGIAKDGRVMIADHDAGGIGLLAEGFEDFLLRHCLADNSSPP